jgi:hypothetical protein
MPTREQRQLATQNMTKCGCGNVARLGQTQCGACALEDQVEAKRVEDKEHALWVLDNCNDFGDLKAFIRDYLLT